jgi:flagellar motor switch protein FliG
MVSPMGPVRMYNVEGQQLRVVQTVRQLEEQAKVKIVRELKARQV